MPNTAKLTATELDTLATMITSAGKHMSDARNNDGNLTWGSREMGAAYTDMVNGYYDIQLRAPGGYDRELRDL
jgi:hypothetical protein